MAEGWARVMGGEDWLVRSAGIEAHGLNPLALQVMAEVGVDLSSHWSKLIDELDVTSFEFVITVCDRAEQRCPVFPGGGQRIHRGFPDPPRLAALLSSDEERLDCYREVRDQIKGFLEAFFSG